MLPPKQRLWQRDRLIFIVLPDLVTNLLPLTLRLIDRRLAVRLGFLGFLLEEVVIYFSNSSYMNPIIAKYKRFIVYFAYREVTPVY